MYATWAVGTARYGPNVIGCYRSPRLHINIYCEEIFMHGSVSVRAPRRLSGRSAGRSYPGI